MEEDLLRVEVLELRSLLMQEKQLSDGLRVDKAKLQTDCDILRQELLSAGYTQEELDGG